MTLNAIQWANFQLGWLYLGLAVRERQRAA